MPNWFESMKQSFEYYEVDPGTWKNKRKIDNIKTCTITRDSDAETLGSATFEITGDIGECYIRVYLVTFQNGITEKFPLGTYLVQTPSLSFDGKMQYTSIDAYTPLLELKESPPPYGYSILESTNIMDIAYRLCAEQVRAPVVKTENTAELSADFVSNMNDTWLTFLSDLIANAKYTFNLDEMGRILFAPKQDTASLQPVQTYDDDNSSILYPEITVNRDLYGIPNVIEVLYSDGNGHYYSRVSNDDENSPISTINRGREVVYRVSDPELVGNPTEHQIKEYAEQLLRELSSLEYTITYKHGYCPARVMDCVRLNYSKAGLIDVKAKVISQSIRCEPGCPVTEKAVFTKKLWR